jgi:hypothetical protein
MPVPLEQPDSQLLLDRLDLNVQRWLPDVQPGGGAREVQLLGDSDEIAKLPQLRAASTLHAGVKIILRWL